MLGLPGRHPRVWARLRDHTREATASIGLTRDGGTETQSEEVSALPGGDSIPGPHRVRFGGRSRPC